MTTPHPRLYITTLSYEEGYFINLKEAMMLNGAPATCRFGGCRLTGQHAPNEARTKMILRGRNISLLEKTVLAWSVPSRR